MAADPRLLARFDADSGLWHVAAGTYRVCVGKAADLPAITADAVLNERRFGTDSIWSRRLPTERLLSSASLTG